MIDIKLKYQASIFVNSEDIRPSPDNISSLIKVFKDDKLIPNTFQELSKGIMQPRVRFSNTQNELSISFATTRIDVEKNPIDPKGNNLGTVDIFCSDVTEKFAKILKKYPKKASRMSLITTYLLKEMSGVQLDKICDKLFKFPQVYLEKKPYEWNWRLVSKVAAESSFLTSEEVNVITKIRRAQGQLFSPKSFDTVDRIDLSLDINTSQHNKDTRFDLTNIKTFYQWVKEKNAILTKEILEFING